LNRGLLSARGQAKIKACATYATLPRLVDTAMGLVSPWPLKIVL
jgi:hypothetical protein